MRRVWANDEMAADTALEPGEPDSDSGSEVPEGDPLPLDPGQPYPVPDPGEPYPVPDPGEPYPVPDPGEPYPVPDMQSLTIESHLESPGRNGLVARRRSGASAAQKTTGSHRVRCARLATLNRLV
jgi:hypothetical protein